MLIIDCFALIDLQIKSSLSLHFLLDFAVLFFFLLDLIACFFFFFFCEKPEETFENGMFFPNRFFFVRDVTTLSNNHSQSNSCEAKHTACEEQVEGYHHMGYEFLTFACAFSGLSCLLLLGLNKKTISF